jgi:signal transduction histidine kinase
LAGAWNWPASWAASLIPAWRALSLSHRFLIAAALAVAVFTLASGFWVTGQIERSLAQERTAAASAIAQDVVGPLVQTLPDTGKLAPNAAAALDGLLSASRGLVIAMRLRRPDGDLVYSNGALTADSRASDAGGRHFEAHVPLYKSGTHELIAVAQIHGIANGAEAGWARAQIWLVLAVLAVAMMAAPFRLVQRAGEKIARQERVIAGQKAQEARLMARTEALRKLAEVVHRGGLEQNERLLRRIGSDLHDGPAQHLALVLLRLDELAPLLEQQQASVPAASQGTFEIIRRATADALKEIRHISAGLALPELQKISVAEALLIAVRAHQRATGTRVDTAIGSLPARLPLPITICLYRFAQEALNNAFRHAGGKGQRVSASYEGGTIVVEVADSGPGFVVERAVTAGERLGLSGLRYRVESLGGSLQINSAIGKGSQLIVQFRNPVA